MPAASTCLGARPPPAPAAAAQDVDEALKRLPQDVLDARNQRLKRAHDLNMKHSELPKDLQQLQTPYSFYLKDALEVGGRACVCVCVCVCVCACVPVGAWAAWEGLVVMVL